MMMALLLSLQACKKRMIGKWSDNIQLSAKDLEFSPNGDSATVTAKGNWWGINCIALDTTYLMLDTASTDFCNVSYTDSVVTIVTKNCNLLKVKLSENKTNKDRTLWIGFSAGDYFDRVKIIQKKK